MIYARLIEVWFSSFIQIEVVTMNSSKKFSEHMRIYGLVKNTLIALLKKRRKQNFILVIPMLTSGGKIFYCLRIFLVK